MVDNQTYHIPVLLNKTIELLDINPDGIYVDVTFGGGGHSREILKHLGTNGRLIAFDRDFDATKNAIEDPRFTLINNNFRFIHSILKSMDIEYVDGILGDLGVSSHHFDTPERGFSFKYNATLDMRMDTKSRFSALNVINDYDIADLSTVLGAWGELQRPYHIASLIVNARPIYTIDELIKAVAPATPKIGTNKFYAKLFQAIRIEVNGEMDALKYMLEGSSKSLKTGGRIAIITYHSIEDRIVKNFFRSGNSEGTIKKDFYGNIDSPFKKVFQDVTPDKEEIQTNSRSRSARLRVAVKK